MKRNLQLLTEREFDLVVIGGGIFGICTAWDAALRGLSVALVEKGDFAHAASGNHFRMVHGGIRYLQHGDINRVRESSQERSILLRIAPHLVHPLPILVPTFGHGMKGKEVLASGLRLYDVLTIDRNRYIKDRSRQIPSGKVISREEVLEQFPEIKKQGLTGAAIFYDGQTYNPARLALAFLKSAVDAGAETANYVEVTDFLRKNGRVIGVRACDLLTSSEFDIRGRMVVNAAGPWAAGLLDKKTDLGFLARPTFSRDACFIVHKKLTNGIALALGSKTYDPDAIIKRGTRHLFVVPWQDKTLVGVWHIVHHGNPESFTVTKDDLQSFLDEVNQSYMPLELSLKDISRWMAGLVLFGGDQVSERHLKYGHRSLLIDHKAQNGIEGLITLIGVRFTTARGMAEKTVDLAVRKLGLKATRSRTDETPVYGGGISDFERFQQQAVQQCPSGVRVEVMQALSRNHGSAFGKILNYKNENPKLISEIGNTRTLKAEVVHAVRHEMALKLSDVVFRRTDIATGSKVEDGVLAECANLMSSELEWDQVREDMELREVLCSLSTI